MCHALEVIPSLSCARSLNPQSENSVTPSGGMLEPVISTVLA